MKGVTLDGLWEQAERATLQQTTEEALKELENAIAEHANAELLRTSPSQLYSYCCPFWCSECPLAYI